MFFGELYRECKKVNSVDSLYLSNEQLVCKYSNVIIVCLKLVRKFVLPIGNGYTVRETLRYSIEAIQKQCQKTESPNPA